VLVYWFSVVLFGESVNKHWILHLLKNSVLILLYYLCINLTQYHSCFLLIAGKIPQSVLFCPLWQLSRNITWMTNKGLLQRCTNLGGLVTRETEFCTVVCNIYGSLVWNLLHVTLLAPRILKWHQQFWKTVCPWLTLLSKQPYQGHCDGLDL
jgi:hypothetical protein